MTRSGVMARLDGNAVNACGRNAYSKARHLVSEDAAEHLALSISQGLRSVAAHRVVSTRTAGAGGHRKARWIDMAWATLRGRLSNAATFCQVQGTTSRNRSTRRHASMFQMSKHTFRRLQRVDRSPHHSPVQLAERQIQFHDTTAGFILLFAVG